MVLICFVFPPSGSFRQGASPLMFPCLEYFSGLSIEASGSQWLFLPFAINLTLYGDSVAYSGRRKKGWAFEKSKEGEGEVFTAEGKGAACNSRGEGGDRFHASF